MWHVVSNIIEVNHKIRFHIHEALSMFPEVGITTSIIPYFIEAKDAIGVLGVCVSVMIGIVTLLIKLKELKDKYKS